MQWKYWVLNMVSPNTYRIVTFSKLMLQTKLIFFYLPSLLIQNSDSERFS